MRQISNGSGRSQSGGRAVEPAGEEETGQLDPAAFKRLRKSRGVTQGWVAEQCGCSIPTISRWERGEKRVSRELETRLGAINDDITSRTDENVVACWSCGSIKPAGEFSADRNRSSGVQSKCRKCNVQLANAWKAQNRKRLNEKRTIRYRLNTTEKRLQRVWGNTPDDRSFDEALEYFDRGEFRIVGNNKGCGPKEKELQGARKSLKFSEPWRKRRLRVVGLQEADKILSGNPTEGVSGSQEIVGGSWYDEFGQRCIEALDRGECTPEQIRRIAQVRCRQGV